APGPARKSSAFSGANRKARSPIERMTFDHAKRLDSIGKRAVVRNELCAPAGDRLGNRCVRELIRHESRYRRRLRHMVKKSEEEAELCRANFRPHPANV